LWLGGAGKKRPADTAEPGVGLSGDAAIEDECLAPRAGDGGAGTACQSSSIARNSSLTRDCIGRSCVRPGGRPILTGIEDPSAPEKSARVLTVMRADGY
jgi:hypothetical protein